MEASRGDRDRREFLSIDVIPRGYSTMDRSPNFILVWV